MFTRKEGCTVRQYADALGISRQAASTRLRRFVELGLLTVAQANQPTSLADLAVRGPSHAPVTHVYRAVKAS